MNEATLRWWVEILTNLRARYPSAILAGGALRDLDNNRPVKDLDIFINEPFHTDTVIPDYECSRWCPGPYIDAAREVECSFLFKPRTFVSSGYDAAPPEINIIQLRADFDVIRVVERVDFGLCQIALVGDSVIRTGLYRKDKRDQMFTLTRADSVAGVKRSLKRYERLSQKYQGWPLEVPGKFLAMVAEASA